MQLDEIPRARLSSTAGAPFDETRVFLDEALSLEPVMLDSFDGETRAWAELRSGRSPADAPDFHGTVRDAPVRAWSVSAIETYLGCPFKFFAQHVLKLERGARGRGGDGSASPGAIRARRLRGILQGLAGRRAWRHHRAESGRCPRGCSRQSSSARSIDCPSRSRTGADTPSGVAGGGGARRGGFQDGSGASRRRGRTSARAPAGRRGGRSSRRHGPRTIALRGKADRLDLLADGTFSLIDYKLGWPPNRARALQLPIYSLCAEQRLAGHRGRSWTLGEAAYLAFKGPRRVVPL